MLEILDAVDKDKVIDRLEFLVRSSKYCRFFHGIKKVDENPVHIISGNFSHTFPFEWKMLTKSAISFDPNVNSLILTMVGIHWMWSFSMNDNDEYHAKLWAIDGGMADTQRLEYSICVTQDNIKFTLALENTVKINGKKDLPAVNEAINILIQMHRENMEKNLV